MSLNFPSNPSNGDTYVRLGRGWKYNSTSGAWEALINVSTAFDSDDVVEGTANLYATQERTDDFVSNLITAGNNISVNYNDVANSLTIDATTSTITGNAGTATALQTARNFSATGDATAPNVSFDGTANVALNLTLANSGVTAGSFGSGSAIPVITVDSKGRITSASTQSVNIVTTTDIAGDSGTDTITLGTDTLTFAGTSSEIETAVTNNQVQIGLPNDVTIGNNLTVTGTLTVNGTTTTINSTQLDVDDLNITIASGAANAAAANGAGITVDGASATLTYASTGDKWVFNKAPFYNTNALLTQADITIGTEGTPAGNGAIAWNSSAKSITYTPPVLNGLTATGTTDFGSNKITYSNHYAQESDLPSASTYHGMFAHVHATNKGYFAHGGNWIKLIDETSSTTADLTEGSNLYFTNERVDDRVAALIVGGSNITATYDDAAGTLTIDGAAGYTTSNFNTDFAAKDTDDLSEGTSNLYFTNTRADARADLRIAAANLASLNNVNNASPTNGQALVWDNANNYWKPGTVGGQITVQDEGSALSTSATTLNFVGAGVTATGTGATKTITISSSVSAISDLSDVDSSGVTNNQILKYVSASSEFQPSFITNSMLDPTNVFVDQFTANGSTGTFTLSSDPGSKNAIQVFVDGVPQKTSGLTVVGTTLTLAGTPTNGQIVEVRGYGVGLPVGTVADNSITGAKLQDNTIGLSKISASNYYTADTFTAGSNQTAYTLSVDPGSPYAITVYIANVWQKPVTNYTVSGTTMTLASAPTAGVEVYVRYYGVALNVGTVADASITGVKLQDGTITVDKIAAGAYQKQTFTGDNTTTAFTLSTDPGVAQALLVMVDNVVQEPTENYTTSGTTLTFTSAPALNARIYVRYLGLPYANASVPADDSVTNAKLNLTYTSNQYTGNNSTTAYTIPAGHTANSVLVILDGLILPPSDYSVSGTTLTFGSAPLLNQSIDIRYMPV
tara:strand:+ start:703 stop:3606 length:2904 start_codon:yes stop_codon:yes gene_type:complete